ncbi:MAG: REP-associated tyrosine transposase [Burkholderiaceae bacterium]
MTSYRRNSVPGGMYFFTIAIANRHIDLLVKHADILKQAIHAEKQKNPFSVIALVILPDHLHAIWRLPEGDCDYSNRWRRIKGAFSSALPKDEYVSRSRVRKGERGIWQRRFWEHTVRDERDLQTHCDYIHFNPVKHGYASKVVDWPHSTFHAYVASGVYPADWGGTDAGIARDD